MGTPLCGHTVVYLTSILLMNVWIISSLLLLQNSVMINIFVHSLSLIFANTFLGSIPGSEIAGSKSKCTFFLVDTAKLPQIGVVPLCIPISNV